MLPRHEPRGARRRGSWTRGYRRPPLVAPGEGGLCGSLLPLRRTAPTQASPAARAGSRLEPGTRAEFTGVHSARRSSLSAEPARRGSPSRTWSEPGRNGLLRWVLGPAVVACQCLSTPAGRLARPDGPICAVLAAAGRSCFTGSADSRRRPSGRAVPRHGLRENFHNGTDASARRCEGLGGSTHWGAGRRSRRRGRPTSDAACQCRRRRRAAAPRPPARDVIA